MHGGLLYIMTLTIYANKSDRNVVSKSISQVQNLTNVLCKDPTNILNPVFFVQITAGNIAAFNYLYAPDFKRYYFATAITRNRTNIEINCEVDVLMSFSSNIKGLNAIVERQTNYYNLYLPDLQIPDYAYRRVQTKVFPQQPLDVGGTMILATSGMG